MGNARGFRRQVVRTIPRAPAIEPCAETRAWVGRMIAAYDDDNVSREQFIALGLEWGAYMATRPRAECIEASMQLQEHVARQLLGCPKLRAVGIGVVDL